MHFEYFPMYLEMIICREVKIPVMLIRKLYLLLRADVLLQFL